MEVGRDHRGDRAGQEHRSGHRVATPTPANLTAVAGTLFFTANDGTTGSELWKSDGTAAGPSLVKDIRPGTSSSFPYDLTALGGTLFFTAYDNTNGQELWKSDGTSGGTVLVKDIRPGTSDSYPYELTVAGTTLFFTAEDASSSRELWKSDGTAAGTRPGHGTAAGHDPARHHDHSGPAAGSTITTSSATFGFSGTPGDTAKLQCSLDGGAFADCTSPRTFTGLANGSHTVAFRAVDAAGNADPTPATRDVHASTHDRGDASDRAVQRVHRCPRPGRRTPRRRRSPCRSGCPVLASSAWPPSGKSPVKAAKVTISAPASPRSPSSSPRRARSRSRRRPTAS